MTAAPDSQYRHSVPALTTGLPAGMTLEVPADPATEPQPTGQEVAGTDSGGTGWAMDMRWWPAGA